MKLTDDEIKKALKISKIIQTRIEITGDTNLRSTDVFPYLMKANIFLKDRHNGVHFRKFLNKLARCGELQSLIPQCTRINPLEDEIFSEWYFHDAKDKMPKSKTQSYLYIYDELLQVNKMSSEGSNMEIYEAIDIIKMLIEGVNPISERPQDDLGVCADMTVIEALKTIIAPVEYLESKIRKSNILPTKTSANKSTTKINRINSSFYSNGKFYSATALAKLKGKSYNDILMIMKQNNLILGPTLIRRQGVEAGLKLQKNIDGKEWIAYPESVLKLI
ncbi:hypothetical protein ACJOV8_001275 [Formosa sp. 3Alg 14/1]|uniref:hypothetical protein n=1 Tax=Formosa sp. 3Alg 14/1 TaxID=3382190 RepID=UPI0039BE5E40